MKNKAHILFVSSWYPSPNRSAGTFVELHILALQSRGYKCSILLTAETTLRNYLKGGMDKEKFLPFRKRDDILYIDNLTVHKLPLSLSGSPLEKRKKNILAETKKNIDDYIGREGKPDLIFHHGVFNFCYLSTFLRKIYRIPIWYLENSPNLKPGFFPCANPFDSADDLKEFARKADRRFAVTKAYMRKMEALFSAPFAYCPNVITDDLFANPAEVQKSDEVFNFVNVAILDPRKNQKLILESFAANFKGQSKFSITIAGDGPLLGELKAHAEALGIAGQTVIPGYVSRTELIELLDKSHCFVLSSHAETFGVVVVEAMARGLPVISTRIEGTAEILNDENGLLVEPDNIEAMAAAMKTIVERYKKFDPARIIASAKNRFGPDAVQKALFPNE